MTPQIEVAKPMGYVIVKKATTTFNRGIPALVAVGGSLFAMPVSALQLGDLTVHSKLGQPLRASIAYALAPQEQLSNFCISMRPGASVSGLPNVGGATISVANGTIFLTGKRPIREPMVSAHVVVNCQYAAKISREYMLFIDPASPTIERAIAEAVTETVATPRSQPAQQTTAAATPVRSRAARTPVRQQVVKKDLAKATRYQVQPGDSVSEIAQRIKDRSIGLWPAVNAIVAANPDAFLDNDPNKLKAGSWLSIPNFDGKPATVTTAAVSSAAPAVASAPVDLASTTDSSEPLTANTATDLSQAVPSTTATVVRTPLEAVVIPDTQLEAPTTNSTSPNVATASIVAPSATDGSTAPATVEDSSSSPWFAWLAGSGIAIILALLLFGRRLRGRFAPAAVLPVVEESPQRRATDIDADTEQLEVAGIDYDLSDDSPTEENLALDADLFIGTGLDNSTDMEVAEEFGFATIQEADVELPFEPQPVTVETAILNPLRTAEESILDSEVFPNEDDEYDTSVIMDTTAYNLRAGDNSSEEPMPTDSYTINDEIDYQVLEQDYENELTATQAMNREFAEAAAELAKTSGYDSADGDNDLTAGLPLATVTELDATAQLPTSDDTAILPDDATMPMKIESGKNG